MSRSEGRNVWAIVGFAFAVVGLMGVPAAFEALGRLSNSDLVGQAEVVAYAFPVWAAATVVLGVQGRRRSRQLRGGGRGLATAAIVMGALELAFAVFAAFALTGCVHDRYHCR